MNNLKNRENTVKKIIKIIEQDIQNNKSVPIITDADIFSDLMGKYNLWKQRNAFKEKTKNYFVRTSLKIPWFMKFTILVTGACCGVFVAEWSESNIYVRNALGKVKNVN
jgi:predicted ATPase